LVSTIPPPTTVQQESSSGLTGRQVLGITSGAVGLALAVVGGVFEVKASQTWSDFNAYYKNGLPTPDQVSQLKTLSDRAKSQQTVGTVMLIAGGSLIAGGAYFFFTGKPDRPAVSAAVGTNLREVSLRVRFP
jgi:hypothetical protein